MIPKILQNPEDPPSWHRRINVHELEDLGNDRFVALVSRGKRAKVRRWELVANDRLHGYVRPAQGWRASQMPWKAVLYGDNYAFVEGWFKTEAEAKTFLTLNAWSV